MQRSGPSAVHRTRGLEVDSVGDGAERERRDAAEADREPDREAGGDADPARAGTPGSSPG